MRTLSLALVVVACLAGCDRTSSKKTQTIGSGSGDDRGVMLLRYAKGSESTEQRERGFMETMQKEFPELRIISE